MVSGTQLLVVLVIILLVFGTKKLRNVGSDLGGAVKGFRDAMKTGENENSTADANEPAQKITHDAQGRVIEGEVAHKPAEKDKV